MFLDIDRNVIYNQLKKELIDNCEICNGEGFVQNENGYKKCICNEKAFNYSFLIKYGMPKKYLNDEIYNFKILEEKYPDVANKIKKITNNNEKNGLYINNSNIFYILKVEAIIAKTISVKFGYSCLFMTASEIVDIFRKNDENFPKIKSILNSVDILFINNLGMESGSIGEEGFCTKTISNIIYNRTCHNKKNIISSHLQIEQLIDRYSIQLFNNINDTCEIINVNNEILV